MKVTIVMGSASDKAIGQQVVDALTKFNIDYDWRIISAHRTPEVARELTEKLESLDNQVVVAIAGKAAHLAGVLAGSLSVPVIGVPVKSSTLDGLDALLSTVQMPKGVPVATVAIDGGYNAGLLAVQILAVNNPQLREAYKNYKVELAQDTIKADQELNW